MLPQPRPLVALAVLAPVASAAITQPPQPKSGPGGSDYSHRGWRVSSGGSGADAWYVFEPARPRPTKAPLAIVMHGYYEYAGFNQMHEFIRHTVRKGSIVIYPRWQTAIATAVPRALRHRAVHEPRLRGIRGALAYLRASPKRGCSRTSARTSYFGFSFGGIITANLTNRYRTLDLPKPRAICLEDPHDGGLVGFDEPAVDDSLRGIPPSVKLQCHSSGEGVISEPNRADGSCNAIFPKLGHIPKRNKDLVLTPPDAHGTPALTAPHGCAPPGRDSPTPTTGTSAGKPGTPCAAAPTTGCDCKYALGNTRQHRSNGRWSDGVPIAPLKIQDAAPIRRE